MLDARLLPTIDYQLLRWHAEGLSTRYMATRLGRPLDDTQRRLEAALESQRRVERFAEAQAAKRPSHGATTISLATRRRNYPDRFSELRARVLAGWTEAQGYFKEREQRA